MILRTLLRVVDSVASPERFSMTLDDSIVITLSTLHLQRGQLEIQQKY